MPDQTATPLDTGAFNAFIDQDQRVLIDFWAPWCPPCRALSPTIDRLGQAFPGRVGKINIDEEPEVARRYGVASIPTVIIFDKGQASEVLVGIRQEQAYTEAMSA